MELASRKINKILLSHRCNLQQLVIMCHHCLVLEIHLGLVTALFLREICYLKLPKKI